MKIGFRQHAKRPTRDDLEREAAEILAARIAEGRPPPDAWKPRILVGRKRWRRPPYRPAQVPAATWYASTPTDTRPLVLRVVRFGEQPDVVPTAANKAGVP